MLTEKTYTPAIKAEATTAILPLLPDHLRRQVLAERARLLDMARSIGKASAGRRVIISISPEKHIRVPKRQDREQALTGRICP